MRGRPRGRILARRKLDVKKHGIPGECLICVSPIDPRLDIRRCAVGYERRLIGPDPVEVAVGLRATYQQLAVTIESPSIGKDDDHLGVFAPALDGRLRWPLGPGIAVEASGGAAWISAGSNTVRGWAAALALQGSPVPALLVSAGYRIETLDLEREDARETNAARLRFRGPGVELRVAF
jgi:hypothetical protein